MTVRILTGDCLDVLKTLADESVQCCVTSPPYYGLRDYGTAEWEGGEEGCDHKGPPVRTQAGFNARYFGKEFASDKQGDEREPMGQTCGKCGARRVDSQIGLEATPDAYVAKLVEVFREVRRVLRDDGTLWLNLGDSYAANRTYQVPDGKWVDVGNSKSSTVPSGLKPKDLIGIPWRVAFALQADGWYLRSDIIWHKPNPMPESVTDRCTKAHEYLFLLSKSERYYFDAAAIAEDAQPYARPNCTGPRYEAPGQTPNSGRTATGDTRNRRSVWTVATQPFSEAHFATFPPALIEPCILAGCPPAGKRCDCDKIISTPTGSGDIDDPSMLTGRAGMNRPRRPDEGTRPITRREQRWQAEQMKASPFREQMAGLAGEAFAHYIRTDDSGARPLPEPLRIDFLRRGWLTDAPPCAHPVEPAGVVLDPFGGAGTTGLVADRLQRSAILIELNPEYSAMAERRIVSDGPLFADVSCP